jgi:hypothetical protein
MQFPWFWVFVGMFFWLFFMRPRRFRACQGRWGGDELRDRMERPRRRMGRPDLESALAERDALITKLEERVRVLERIVTDDSARLRAEIDSLGDTPAGGRF